MTTATSTSSWSTPRRVPEDILVRITAVNRGPEAAELHLLPTLWFRNDWSAWIAESNRSPAKPSIKQIKAATGTSAVAAAHPLLGEFTLSCEGEVPLLFTENETNHERLFPGQKNESPYVKDGINDCVVQGRQDAVNPGKQGTKVAAHYRVTVGAGQTVVIRLRLSSISRDRKGKPFGKAFDEIFADRLREADEFYQSVTPPSVSADAANVMRQALAGMLWSKQFFFFDGDNWLDEHNSNPLHSGYRSCPELGMVPHAQRGHHLDARQVGVSLVRRLGPGVPLVCRCRSSTPISPRSR